jgi:DNA-directed RNA polymerase subunit RPC12/RpoP|tara:strand:+ start:2889 stop:3554 length:666 start_codon:yes stop_codon:yes gene_type:complete
MNAKDVIEGLLGVGPKKETKERTIVCRICEKDYTYTVKKGRQPSVCKEEVCDAARKKGYLIAKPKVVRTHTCAYTSYDGFSIICDVEITQHGRGGKKLYCDEHRIAVSQKQHKKFREDNFVSKVREQGNCKDCQKPLGDKTGKGKLRVRCPVCQMKRVYKKAAENRTLVVREYTCRVCEKKFEQHGQGQLRKSCKTCKYPIKPTKKQTNDMLDGMFSEVIE